MWTKTKTRFQKRGKMYYTIWSTSIERVSFGIVFDRDGLSSVRNFQIVIQYRKRGLELPWSGVPAMRSTTLPGNNYPCKVLSHPLRSGPSITRTVTAYPTFLLGSFFPETFTKIVFGSFVFRDREHDFSRRFYSRRDSREREKICDVNLQTATPPRISRHDSRDYAPYRGRYFGFWSGLFEIGVETRVYLKTA